MSTTSGRAARSAVDQVVETRRLIRELTEAWTRRHKLPRGTPEYVRALEAEERLAIRIWQRFRETDRRVRHHRGTNRASAGRGRENR